jgi:hypothetical protein
MRLTSRVTDQPKETRAVDPRPLTLRYSMSRKNIFVPGTSALGLVSHRSKVSSSHVKSESLSAVAIRAATIVRSTEFVGPRATEVVGSHRISALFELS